jgi:hypothetical protein
MLVTLRNKAFLRLAEVYFEEPASARIPGADLILVYQSPRPSRGARAFHSLHIDLRRTPDEIMAGLGKNNRYKIRRAKDRDGLTVEAHDHPDDGEIRDFTAYYDVFARQKGLASCNPVKLSALRAQGALALTAARGESGEPLARHAYVVTPTRARLLYSASHYRDISDSKDRNQVGRANRLLHWRDILHFKERGLALYDLGGLSGPPGAPPGPIDDFKLGFGGTRVVEYNSMRSGSLIGSIARRILRARAA